MTASPIVGQALVEGAVLFWSDVRWVTSPDGLRLVELLLGSLYLLDLFGFFFFFSSSSSTSSILAFSSLSSSFPSSSSSTSYEDDYQLPQSYTYFDIPFLPPW